MSYPARDEKHQFRSYRLTGPYEQPWISDKRLKRTRYNSYIVYGLMVLGLGIAGYLCYNAVASVPKHNYCLVLDENFQTLDSSIWNHEVQVDGFGTGSFEWTTTDSANSFVDSDGLHIVPTLTNQTTSITSDQLMNGYTLNLTTDGTCTSTDVNVSCAVTSNSTYGTMLPPVRSARLTTAGKKTIKYGRVEVVAKLPKGDWLWPAIWMMPQNSVYGAWPRSGEIDIMESRGNGVEYPDGGVDNFASTLHWGPSSDLDAFWRSTAGRTIRRRDFSQDYHTFGLEWSKNYLYTYMDSKLQNVFYTGFGPGTMWDRGKFAAMTVNNTLLVNPWGATGNPNTPFDQDFYLILNVAVGSLNGYFPDSVGSKPWVDASTYLARGDFWRAADKWLPTWGTGNTRGMTVKSVKMWQEGACS